MNLETKIIIYKFTPQVFTLTHFFFLRIFERYYYIIDTNLYGFSIFLLLHLHRVRKRCVFDG